MSSEDRTWSRVAAALGGCALGVVAVYGLAWTAFIVLVATAVPDGLAPEADPCCTPPATWGEVLLGVIWALGSTALETMLVHGAVSLGLVAARGRGLRTRYTVLLAPGVVTGIVAVGLAAAILPRAGQARIVPRCDGFVLRRSDLRSADRDLARVTAAAAHRCGSFEGEPVTAVLWRLGAPDTRERGEGRQEVLVYGPLRFDTQGDRVRRALADDGGPVGG